VAFALAFETEEQSLSAATNDRKAAPMRSARGFFWQCVEDMRRVETQGMPSRVFTLTWPVARVFFFAIRDVLEKRRALIEVGAWCEPKAADDVITFGKRR
jgi:hypothetical protein